MKRKVITMIMILVMTLALAGCNKAKTLYTNADKSTSAASEDAKDDEVVGRYDAHGFSLDKVMFGPSTMMLMPTEQDIVFLFNGQSTGTMKLGAAGDKLLTLNVDFTLDEDASGTVMLVVTDENGKEYVQEDKGNFGVAGANTLSAHIKTESGITAAHTYVLTIDGNLVAEGQYKPAADEETEEEGDK
ncbi:hypothetical protein LJC51_06745 [Lachnospiraceae bacterium OttesenSCG-928-J05]|nr:hypothetical protein [Lachnospiraceae bacterium OttesenSCG-928-J05]